MIQMKSPFVYGKVASESSFTDREKDCASLVQDFINLTNTIIISPRRWGKSSLVRRAGEEASQKDKHLRVCHLDIFNVRNEDEFYEKLAKTIIQGTSSPFEDFFSTALKYAASLVPAISAGDMVNTIKLEFKVKDFHRNADDILDMAEKIAEEKNLHIVVCIDEFQQIASFSDPLAFQAKLRSHWQLHSRVAYCLYGSRRHMMIEVFSNKERPFYQFGKTIFLKKIDARLWPAFIADKFKGTQKSITQEQCERIVELTDNNPYYIQRLSEEVWNITDDTCHDNYIQEAFETIVQEQADLNLSLTQTLTITQQNLLNAIAHGEKELSSASVIAKYDLKSNVAVQRAKSVLIKMDIIDNFEKRITIEDPIYAYWLREIYFSA